MVLITGGAYQGQETYAEKIRKQEGTVADGTSASMEEMKEAAVILNLHAWVRRLIEEKQDPMELAGQLFAANPGGIYTTVEVGSGIVPIDPTERDWREAAGRVGCLAAEHSEQVIRIICGIPTRIK